MRMMRARVLAIAMMAYGLCAHAEVTPGLPVQQVNPPQAQGTGPQAPLAAGVEGADGLTPEERRVAAGLLAPAPRNSEVATKPPVKAPPPQMTVKAGVTTIFAIGRGQTNRIVVPFKKPKLMTSATEDQAKIDVDPDFPLVYVTTSRSEPVSMFIYDENDKTTAISVSLVPADIPAVSVTMRLENYVPREPVEQTARHEGDAKSARGWETDQPFTDSVKELFRNAALGKVPSGYSLGPLDPRSAAAARCDMPGLRIEQKQLLTGFNMQLVVARVTNMQPVPVDIVETGCRGADVLAAAAWPAVHLQPGQAAELYVAIRAPGEDASDVVRPSLVSEGR